MTASSVNVRTALVEALQLDLVGPGNNPGRVVFDIAAIQQNFKYDEVWLVLGPVGSA
jgi:hypothetical protein